MNPEWINKARLLAPENYREFRIRIGGIPFDDTKPTTLWYEAICIVNKQTTHIVVKNFVYYANRRLADAIPREITKLLRLLENDKVPFPKQRITIEFISPEAFLISTKQINACCDTTARAWRKVTFTVRKLLRAHKDVTCKFILGSGADLYKLVDQRLEDYHRIKIQPRVFTDYEEQHKFASVRAKRSMLNLWKKPYISQE